MGIHGWSAKAAAKSVGNVGRKFMTAFAKKTRPKTGSPKPMSDAWRADNVRASKLQNEMDWETEGVFPEDRHFIAKTRNALKQHQHAASQAAEARIAKRQSDWDAGYPKAKKAKAPQKRVSFKGQDMTEKNFHKSFSMRGGYKYGSIVSKEAMRTSPNVRLSGGGTGAKKALLDSYGSRGFRNYKTRSYER